jgi:hypothetical protein
MMAFTLILCLYNLLLAPAKLVVILDILDIHVYPFGHSQKGQWFERGCWCENRTAFGIKMSPRSASKCHQQ